MRVANRVHAESAASASTAVNGTPQSLGVRKDITGAQQDLMDAVALELRHGISLTTLVNDVIIPVLEDAVVSDVALAVITDVVSRTEGLLEGRAATP